MPASSTQAAASSRSDRRLPPGTPESLGRAIFARHQGLIRHSLFCMGAVLVYLFLNRPEIILLAKLGTTGWFPAAGLSLAVMLGLSPRYMPLFAVANGLAGVLFYHQPLLAWGTLVGAPLETAAYAYVAYVLRQHFKIDNTLGLRYDVVRYVVLTLIGASFSAAAGATCLLADHTVQSNQFWKAGLVWFCGDAIGMFSVGPFLLIHVIPRIDKWLQSPNRENLDQVTQTEEEASGLQLLDRIELVAQAASFLLLFWLMFGRAGTLRHDYAAFLPIIWIAMRHGIRGIVSALLAFNFGIVLTLRLVPSSPELLTKLSFLMLAFSATGLILGSAVTERRSIANELKERTVFLRSLIGNSPLAIAAQDRNAGINLVNDAFLDLFQYGPFEVIGKDMEELIVPSDEKGKYQEMKRIVQAGRTAHETARCKRKDGQIVHVELNAMPLYKNGRIQGGYAIYKDISGQVRAEALAKEQAELMDHWVSELQVRATQITLLNEMGNLLQSAQTDEEACAIVGHAAKNLFNGTDGGALFMLDRSKKLLSPVALWGTDAPTKPFELDECWSLHLAQPHWSECPGSKLICDHVDNSATANYLCIPMFAQGEVLGVLHLQCKGDGTSGDIEADLTLRESQKRLAVAAAGQVALALANLRLRDALREQAIRDSLTGLFNRRFMQESLNKEVQRARRKHRCLSIVFVDLDHFKRFNDQFGHEAGDSVLRSMAETLRLHFRAEDVICRYGGEEFAVILPEASVEDACKRAEALRAAVRDLKLTFKGVPLDRVTLSAGIAGFPEHGQDAQEVLERADLCLYQSKANGRDRVTLAEQPTVVPVPR